MKRIIEILIAGFLLCCTGIPEKGITGLDGIIRKTADRAVELLGTQPGKAVAVYYFTMNGEIHPSSDYITGGLTTSIANEINTRGLDVRVVSRTALDRIVGELEFQASGFADEKSQLQLGKQLGADIILTGTITPQNGVLKLNAQLIVVETGVVLGGIFLAFEGETESEQSGSGISTASVEPVSGNEVPVTGVATDTVIFESFNSPVPGVQVRNHEHYDRKSGNKMHGRMSIAEKAGADLTGCVEYDFEGSFTEQPDHRNESTHAGFELEILTGRKPRNFEGISFSLLPEGYTFVECIISQERDDNVSRFFAPLMLEEGVWQNIKIGFGAFSLEHGRKSIEPDASFSLHFNIPVIRNYEAFWLRPYTEFAGALIVDNLGMFTAKGRDEPQVLETFNDEITRLPYDIGFFGIHNYEDPSFPETSPDFRKPTPGINGARIERKIVERGEGDSFLMVKGKLTFNGEYVKFVRKTPHPRGIGMTFQVMKRFDGKKGLVFNIKSSALREGGIEIFVRGRMYRAEIRVGSIWSRVTIPFSDMRSPDGETLAGVKSPDNRVGLNIGFHIPEELIFENERRGEVEVDFAIDDIMFAE